MSSFKINCNLLNRYIVVLPFPDFPLPPSLEQCWSGDFEGICVLNNKRFETVPDILTVIVE